MRHLAVMLGQDSTIQSFSCVQNALNCVSLGYIADQLGQNSHLLSLRLDKNNLIADDGVCRLVKALSNNTTLTSLSLWQNKIGDIGASALSQLLHKNQPPLELLDVSDNSLSDDGAVAIGNSLAGNMCLQLLYIFGNSIGSQGAQAIGRPLLSKNSTLEQIFLNDNKIGDEGAWQFAKAMQANGKIQRIDLRDNPITAAQDIIGFLGMPSESRKLDGDGNKCWVGERRHQKGTTQRISF